MKVWITKYALTQGVWMREAEFDEDYPRMTTINLSGYTTHFHGGDWHTSKEAAETRVANMIAKKRASLQRQLAALDRLVVKWEEE